jgi:hypothetical protein
VVAWIFIPFFFFFFSILDYQTVSFDEFLAMFRSDNVNKTSTQSYLLSSLKQFSEFDAGNSAAGDGSSDDVDISDDLVGIDAVIPGGKYDTEREQEDEA